jgi:hypothetical protein
MADSVQYQCFHCKFTNEEYSTMLKHIENHEDSVNHEGSLDESDNTASKNTENGKEKGNKNNSLVTPMKFIKTL